MVGNFCNRTACRIQKPKTSSRQQHDSAKKENPKSLPTLHGLDSRTQICAPSSRRGSFSLDSPQSAVQSQEESAGIKPETAGDDGPDVDTSTPPILPESAARKRS